MSRYQGTPQFRAQACVIAHQWLVRKAKTTGTRRVQRDSMGTDPIAAEIYPRGHNLFRTFHLEFFAQPRNQLISATTSNVPQDEHRYASVFPVNGSRRRLLPSAGLKYKSLLGRPCSGRNRMSNLVTIPIGLGGSFALPLWLRPKAVLSLIVS